MAQSPVETRIHSDCLQDGERSDRITDGPMTRAKRIEVFRRAHPRRSCPHDAAPRVGVIKVLGISAVSLRIRQKALPVEGCVVRQYPPAGGDPENLRENIRKAWGTKDHLAFLEVPFVVIIFESTRPHALPEMRHWVANWNEVTVAATMKGDELPEPFIVDDFARCERYADAAGNTKCTEYANNSRAQ